MSEPTGQPTPSEPMPELQRLPPNIIAELWTRDLETQATESWYRQHSFAYRHLLAYVGIGIVAIIAGISDFFFVVPIYGLNSTSGWIASLVGLVCGFGGVLTIMFPFVRRNFKSTFATLFVTFSIFAILVTCLLAFYATISLFFF